MLDAFLFLLGVLFVARTLPAVLGYVFCSNARVSSNDVDLFAIGAVLICSHFVL
jgi:hypothetical protein